MSEIKDLKQLEDVLCQEVHLLYTRVTLLINAVPLFISNVQEEQLKALLTLQMEQAEVQQERLVKVIKYLDIQTNGSCNEDGTGLLAEKEKFMETYFPHETSDLGVATTFWKVLEHDVTHYNQAAALAEACNFSYVAELLRQSEEEQIESCEILNALPLSDVNKSAIAA